MHPKHATGHRALVLGTALLFSTGGIAIKATDLSVWQVSAFRSLVAAVALFALIPDARRNWSWRPVLVGIPYAATFTCYVLANKYTTALNAIILDSTAPLYVLLLAPLLLRERIKPRDLGFVAAFAGGMALIFSTADRPTALATDPLLGNLIGAASGFFFALALIGLRWLAIRPKGTGNASVPAVVAGNFFAALIALPMALPMHGETSDWMIIAYLGIFQVGLAYALLTAAMRHVPTLSVSLTLLLVPVLSPLWVWLTLGETPTPQALAGSAIILGATLAHART